ncbi:MAG: hypothetical protein LBE34_09410 [Flavobacteriaceae bacterium]|jgi:hypothetical protein|nr:hypothetical protein [Flavobacteriaceae bacterium]
MERILKLGVVAIFLLCLLPMSKELFEFTRFILIVLFGILAYTEHLNANIKLFGFYLAMIVLFQPFIPIPLDKMMWNVVHLVLAVAVLGSLFLVKKQKVQPIEE